MAIAIPSPLPDATGSLSGKVSLTAQTLGAGPKTIAQVVTPIVNNTNGTGATDVCVKLGTSVADGSVNTTAKLVSVRTGIAGTETEKLSVLKSGALTTASTIGMTSDPSAPLSAAGEVKIRSNAGAIQASQNGGAYANLGGVDVTLTAIGSTPNANGASLAGQALNLQPASLLYGGVVTSGTQAFGGQKSFNDTFVLATTGLTSQVGLDLGGAPGNQTVNEPNGVAAIASGATSVTITNSMATLSSKIGIEWYGDHGAIRSWVVRANGSFTVTLSSAASANTPFAWSIATIQSTLLSGLTHSWSLDGNSNDVFVTGNGTDINVTYVAGKLGQAASFNGTTSKITTSVNGPLGASPRSVSMWLNKTSTANRNAFGYGIQLSGQSFDVLYFSGMCIYDTGATSSPQAMSTGVWHHFAATYNGTTVQTYLDGVAGTPWVHTLNTVSSTPINIGTGVHSSFAWWDGLIDDVQLSSRAWTSTEVASLYNGSVGRYYPF